MAEKFNLGDKVRFRPSEPAFPLVGSIAEFQGYRDDSAFTDRRLVNLRLRSGLQICAYEHEIELAPKP